MELIKDYDYPCKTKMYHDLKGYYWWSGIKKEIVEFVARCLVCQQAKAEQRQTGLLQSLKVLEWKLEHISIDFVMRLAKTSKKFNVIWVIMDRLTKSAHFLPIQATYPLDQLAQLYVDEILQLHGVPLSIVSIKDLRFAFRF